MKTNMVLKKIVCFLMVSNGYIIIIPNAL